MSRLHVNAQKMSNGDVKIFKETGEHWVTFESHRSDCPDRRFKYLNLNCYRYSLRWLPSVLKP